MKKITQIHKRFSIIQLNEFDDFFNDTPELLEEFLNLINHSVKKYHTTVFLTTNNPLIINKKILDKTELKIPIKIANKKDIHDIISYYINNREIQKYNSDKIVEEFEKVKPEYAYSNAQIRSIIENLPNDQCHQNDFISAIQATRPCITEEINKKFENEQKYFEKGTSIMIISIPSKATVQEYNSLRKSKKEVNINKTSKDLDDYVYEKTHKFNNNKIAALLGALDLLIGGSIFKTKNKAQFAEEIFLLIISNYISFDLMLDNHKQKKYELENKDRKLALYKQNGINAVV